MGIPVSLNPNLDPLQVGPVAAAVNLYRAAMCVPLSASIWAPGALVRAARRLGL
jgi:hypothetical protein